MMITLYANQKAKEKVDVDFNNVLAMISGTSTCAMVLNKERKCSKKIWGNYES